MAGVIRKLSELELKAWVKNPARTPAKLFDGAGLYAVVTPAGTPVWRFRYRYAGADRTLALGTHEALGLRGAREAAERAHEILQQGRDPNVVKRVEKAANIAASGVTFAECAEEWLAVKRRGWSKSHYKTVSETFGRHVFQHLGNLPIADVTQPLIAAVVERVGDRIDTAQKVRQQIAGVFRLAMARGKLPGLTLNPADAAREVIARKRRTSRQPALLTFPELGDVLRRARVVNLSPATHMAHRLCAFSAQRSGNIAAAAWEEFDLDAGTWTIPREKMKVQNRPFDHLVFFSPRFVDELRAWWTLNGAPSSGWLFSLGKRHIIQETLEKAYRVTLRLSGRHVPHGWRSALSTLAQEAGFDSVAVDMMLDHVHDTKVALAYDRGDRRHLRLDLARWWGDQLFAAENGLAPEA